MSETQPDGKQPAATVEPAAGVPAGKTPPLELRRGARLQLGYRLGRVEAVRGGGKKPYDVRVRSTYGAPAALTCRATRDNPVLHHEVTAVARR